MTTRMPRRLLALYAAALLLLSACASPGGPEDRGASTDAGSHLLTLSTWSSYNRFLELLGKECPDIELGFLPYAGANQTGYSWAQMRGDDIPDIFITTQILNQELAEERLADLSGYSFINRFPTPILDQVSISGGIYLLPVNYAMYGTFYNQTLMEEHGWEVPENFAELEALCAKIREAGLIPGVLGTQLTGNPFSAVFNLAKTGWLTTPEGMAWERDFLAGDAPAAGMWEETMAHVQRLIDIGMFQTDPEDRNNPDMLLDYLGNRKSVFFTSVMTVNITELPDTGDKLGIMPYIGEDGSKNVYMYSPISFIGLSRHLTEPGNEEKLEKALRLLSLLFSEEGQAAFISAETPCVLSVLNNTALPEDSLIYDAQQALWEGRAFPMTYAGWENVLADIGQAYKEWFRGENGMDGPGCIARMDALQQSALAQSGHLYFCESTADFTLEETGALVGRVLGSAAGADAAMVPIGTFYKEGPSLRACVTGKLYAGKINTDTSTTVLPAFDGKYAVLSMTGAQAKELAQAGFDKEGDGRPFPYVLSVRGGGELEDSQTYQVAFPMDSYTGETAEACAAEVREGSLRNFLREYLEKQKMVSPDDSWE